MIQLKVQAILIATDEESSIIIAGNNKLLYIPGKNYKRHISINRHLHIISDEEIKYGDWFINELKELEQAYLYEENLHIANISPNCKKVIASKDKSLGLPSPDNNSIQYIIDDFNSGKTEVYGVVDYEIDYISSSGNYGRLEEREGMFTNYYYIKTNPDNTISIKQPYLNEPIDIENNYLNNTVSIKPIGIIDHEEIGKQIVEYAKKYEGTDKYNDVKLAIEFGHKLSEQLEVKPIEESWKDINKRFAKSDWQISLKNYMNWLKQNYSVPTKLK